MPAEQTYRYTWQDIERYLNGSMNAQEMHDLERAALNDPLLADAIDGYQKADAAVSAKHLNEISALLHKTEVPVLPMPAKKNNWWRWAAAAGVMGILGMSAWLMMRENSPVGADILVKNDATTPVTDSQAVKMPVSDNTNVALGDTTAEFLTQKKVARVDTLSTLKTNVANPQITGGNRKPVPEPVLGEATPVNEIAAAKLDATAPEGYMANNDVQSKVAPANPNIQVFSRKAASAPMVSAAHSRQASNELQKGFSFAGLITDQNGKPLPGATVISGNIAAVSNNYGKFNFSIPTLSDSLNVHISAIGFGNETATLFPGRTAGIALQPHQSGMDEIVVVGYGSQKRKAMVGSIKNLKVDTLSTTEFPYPEGGWEIFYDDLISQLGVNKSKADKLLHLKFIIEGGVPSHFTILKTPDMAIADRAIAAIKKGPRWKNFKNGSYAEIKMKVE